MNDQRDHFLSKLHALNEGFASFVENQLKDQKSELWLDGAREYIQYGEALLKEFESVRESEPAGKTGQFGASKPWSIGAPDKDGLANGASSGGQKAAGLTFGAASQPSTSGAEKSDDKPASGLFNFGGAKSKEAAPSFGGGFNFGAAKPSTEATGFKFGGADGGSKDGSGGGGGMFGFGKSAPGQSLFGAPPKPSEAGSQPTGQSLFGGLSKTTGDSASNPFKPGGISSSGGAFAALGNGESGEGSQGGDEEGNTEEDNTGESIANAVDPSASILFSGNSSFHVQTNDDGQKGWSNKGKGTLTVRKAKEGSARPYIVFTTESGRVLLNASLHKDVKAIKNGPKRVVTLLYWARKEGGTPEPGNVYFAFANSEKQEECISHIEAIAKQ